MAGLDALLQILAAIQAARTKVNQGISSLDPKPRNEDESRAFEAGDYFRERGGPGSGISVGALKAMDPRALRLLIEAKQTMPIRLWNYLAKHPEDILVSTVDEPLIGIDKSAIARMTGYPDAPYLPNVEVGSRGYSPHMKHELGHTGQLLIGKRGVPFPGVFPGENVRKAYSGELWPNEAFAEFIRTGQAEDQVKALQGLEDWFGGGVTPQINKRAAMKATVRNE